MREKTFTSRAIKLGLDVSRVPLYVAYYILYFFLLHLRGELSNRTKTPTHNFPIFLFFLKCQVIDSSSPMCLVLIIIEINNRSRLIF